MVEILFVPLAAVGMIENVISPVAVLWLPRSSDRTPRSHQFK
jgi:hypothetical protein